MKSHKSSFRSFRTCPRITRKATSQSNGICRRVKRLSSARSGRRSSTSQPAFGRPTTTLSRGTSSMYNGSRPVSSTKFSAAHSSQHFNVDSNGSSDEYGSNEKGAEVDMLSRLQIAMSRIVWGWPLYMTILASGRLLGATSFQITLLSGQNFQTNLQLYVLGSVFLAALFVWYLLFHLKPSVYVLPALWIF